MLDERRQTRFERAAVAAGLFGIVYVAVSFATATGPSVGRLNPAHGVSFAVAPGPVDPGDATLAVWAVEAWKRVLGGSIRFMEVSDPGAAQIRIEWAESATGRCGEMQPTLVNGGRGAFVRIRPAGVGFGSTLGRRSAVDPVFRAIVIYLTCLPELGHALGLSHSDEYGDVMFDFADGGNVVAFFERYRRRVNTAIDIRRLVGLSSNDIRRVRELYP